MGGAKVTAFAAKPLGVDPRLHPLGISHRTLPPLQVRVDSARPTEGSEQAVRRSALLCFNQPFSRTALRFGDKSTLISSNL